MFFGFVVGLALAATAPATPSPAPAPAQGQPLRTVVFKVTQELRQLSSQQSYEGHNTSTGGNLDAGTVTVNIMAVENDALGLQVIEHMNSKGHPYEFTGSVTPDGSVYFEARSIEDVTRELLQFFGTQFAAARSLDVGTKWDVNVNRPSFTTVTQFTVKRVNGTVVTLDESQKATIAGMSGSAAMTGSVDYKPTLLVPMRGDLQKTLTISSPTGEDRQILTMHFERVSDSRDK
jgi:hypothetical protein